MPKNENDDYQRRVIRSEILLLMKDREWLTENGYRTLAGHRTARIGKLLKRLEDLCNKGTEDDDR